MPVVSHIEKWLEKSGWIGDYTLPNGERVTTAMIAFQTTGAYSIGIQKSFYFPSNTSLDSGNAIITGIELISTQTLQQSFDPIRQNAELNGQDIATGGGVLYISNLERKLIAQIPLWSLIRQNNNGKLTMFDLRDQIWQNCYVEFTDMSGLFNASKGLMFKIYYKPI